MAGPAMADAIDGNWCSLDGRHFEIRGPSITMPGGGTATGDYSRHAFAYAVPEGQPDAGMLVGMVLINDQMLRLKTDRPAEAEPEVWKRCEFVG